MRMYSSRIICHALILIFIMAVSGCAKRMVAAKDVNQIETAGVAAVQAINVKDDTSQIEISTNRPLTYTSYKTSDPPKVFIDLAQTEPGAVTKPLEFASGNVKSVNLSRQDFGGGFLTRVEIALNKDVDFSVSTDPADRGKLLVTFAKPQVEEKSSKAEVEKQGQVASNVEENAAKPDVKPETKSLNAEMYKQAAAEVAAGVNVVTHETKPEVVAEVKEGAKIATPGSNPVELQTSVEVKEPPKAEAEVKSEIAPQLKTLDAINIVNDGVEIIVNGGVDSFNTFKLNKPDRLVVDIFGAKNSISANFISINRFGVGKARVGVTPEKVRIVFDAAAEALPAYEVAKTDNGLKIHLSDISAEQPAKNVNEPLDEPAKPASEAKKVVKTETGSIESIDFNVVDGNSRIAIKLNGDCISGKPIKTAKGLSFTIKNCRIPKKLQRTLDTRGFAGPVQSITPYQVKVAGGMDVRILVKLRGKAPYTINQDGDILLLDIKNPEVTETPALVSGVTREKAAPAAPKIEEEFMAAPAKEPEAFAELPSSAVSKQVTKKVYTGRKVTLEFSDADIRKIFQLIAEVSNLNFLIADDVSGTISIKLVNVPWDQALDVILDTKGLGMQREGNIVQIKPKAKMQSQADEEIAAKKARERAMELRTEVFDVNYAAVADIVTQFNTLKSERGIITSDVRTNRVIVKDIATAIEDMKSLLKNLDSPEKQVMIEARIVEAQTSFVRDLGVQWGLHYVDGSASVAGISRFDTGFGGVVTPPPTSGTSGPGAAAGMSFGKLASNIQIDMRLSAAVTAEQIKIISSPRVVTLNNKPAKISQGASIPYQTTSAEGTKTEFVEAALTLEVTPHITSDGSIGMKIKASNNSAGTGSPPPINKKEATTELLVKNGETTVIGGIYVDSETDNDKGVPFLQDIPLLGWLFKSNTKNKSKNELLIFITPKIIS
ncbi:type IV pilus secretin family protein [Geotalea uraniireducens]|uniref:Type IV pilus secretin PilQ n=1 Tax=Geotalea uraniireducens (strain Rf4) TaxID=351605 RepID=A5GEZ9_GEOUR|nr:type IV pilus secretin family protein [Geotalea uraniireducens]ABQ26004.1 type IV pilus secretin PilQ [Geotalea uraniireducens Rf4]